MLSVSALLVAGGLAVAAAWLSSGPARAQPAAPVPAAPTNCKAYGTGKCCDPAVMQHLPKEAVFTACGESEATFLGEKGSKDTCRYVFKAAEGDKGGGKEEPFVELYAPAAKEVPESPTDPFFSWKRVGKVYVTDKAKSPKSAPMLAQGTGLFMPGRGFYLQVNASTRVCTKAEATRLARSMK